MTIVVINGRPHAYYAGIGPVRVRGASLRDAQALDNVVALAFATGHIRTTVPGLRVVPDIPDVQAKRRIGFV